MSTTDTITRYWTFPSECVEVTVREDVPGDVDVEREFR